MLKFQPLKIVLLLFTLLLIGVSGCKQDAPVDYSSQYKSWVRFLHLSPDASSAAITVDKDNFPALTYLNNTEYHQYSYGTHPFSMKFSAAGRDTTIIDTLQLASNTYYTVILTDSAYKATTLVLDDNFQAPTDKAVIRFVDLIPRWINTKPTEPTQLASIDFKTLSDTTQQPWVYNFPKYYTNKSFGFYEDFYLKPGKYYFDEYLSIPPSDGEFYFNLADSLVVKAGASYLVCSRGFMLDTTKPLGLKVIKIK